MTFDESYSREQFISFLNEFLPDFKSDQKDLSLPRGVQNVKAGLYLGSSPTLDIEIFELQHEASNEKRIGLATDGFRIMKESASFQALVTYVGKSGEWRLSLMTATPEIIDGGKVITKLSNPKRFSFALGPGSKVATPTKFLLQKGKVADLEDLKSRFSVEVVNNEFYGEVSKLYDELIGTDEAPGVLKYPDLGETNNEFAVRLIGRIIFCWFLREKRSDSGMPLVPASILSREAANQDSYYHSVLAPLFFEVLNKLLKDRDDKFQVNEFATVPYLNGGLFNPDSEDHYKFDKALQLSVPGLIDIPDDWLRKLFDLLELYNFTVDENTSYDIDLSIDPEMLGRIFENLLARINPDTGETVRKATGSFYTPREIVEYMVDSSLKEYLKEQTTVSEDKLMAIISYDLLDDKHNPLKDVEKVEVINALSRLKILDPACGSGAFPIGILQKIVFILQQVDPEARNWLEKQLVGASPELKQHLQREFQNKNFDYLRKLGVIRDSIYGIDIQPIATEISRLRCFLTLVVDQSVEDKELNRGVEPLPNLDFKFVTANSLIGLGDIKATSTNTQTGLFEDQLSINDLKELRNSFFGSHNSERESIKSRFLQVQNQMLQKMIAHHSHGFAEVTQKLSSWDPFSHKSTGWFDSEWMFGVTDGFDLVIGNPPYFVYQGHNKNEIPLIKSIPKYDKAQGGKLNAYKLFLALAPTLLKQGGIVSFIFQNSFLADNSAKKIRQYYLKNLRILVIDSFPERDNAHKRVFESVKMSVCVMLAKHESPDNTIFILNIWADKHKSSGKVTSFTPQELEIYDPLTTTIPYLLEDEKNIFSKCFKAVNKESISCFEGELNMTFHRKYFTRNPKNPKTIKGAQVQRYKLVDNLSQGILEYVDDQAYLADFGTSNKSKHHEEKRIAMQGITGVDDKQRFVMAIVPAGQYCANSCNYIIVNDKKYSEYLILGLFNSFLINWIFKKTSTNSNVNCYEVENMPIPLLTTSNEKTRKMIIDKVKLILSGVENQREVELEIDQLIYKLFDLTPQEIAIIENAK